MLAGLFKAGTLATCVVMIGACSSSGDGGSTSFECQLGTGALTGAWLVHFTEKNGNCGPIADSLNIVDGDPDPSCTIKYKTYSADHCKVDQDFTCPTKDGLGTQRWVTALTQVAKDRVSGLATVTGQHPSGNCESMYQVDITDQ